MKRLFAAIALLLVMGCSSATIRTEGAPIDRTKLSEIRPGVTTRKEVIDAFGEPAKTTLTESREDLVYVYSEKKAPVFLGIIENQTQASTEATVLEVVLQEGIVSSYRYKTGPH